MGTGFSAMTRWVERLRDERQGKTLKSMPITLEKIEVHELKKKLQRAKLENDILKKLSRA